MVHAHPVDKVVVPQSVQLYGVSKYSYGMLGRTWMLAKDCLSNPSGTIGRGLPVFFKAGIAIFSGVYVFGTIYRARIEPPWEKYYKSH
jgi:hypothetical protein